MIEEPTLDISKLIKRLELIRNLIALEEEDEINAHIVKLEQQNLPLDVKNIVKALKSKSYSEAVTTIDTFINSHQRLVIYNDPQVEALRLDIRSLEVELNALSNDKADLEKVIHEFGVRHNKELGELLLKVLRYRKEKAKGTNNESEAEYDYNTYQNQFEASKDEQEIVLTDEEQKELKDKYRKASKLCHPDVVSNEQKELATKLFSELSLAYEENDLEKVKEILSNLEKGNFFVSKSDVISEKQILKAEMEKLRFRIAELKKEIELIKNSETYKTIISIVNWDEYFEKAKLKLQQQANNFEDGQ